MGCTFHSAPHIRDSHRCALVRPPPMFERGPQNVETMDPLLHEEEMTHHRLPQQPPLPGRDQRAPPQGETGVLGRTATAAGAPPLEECPPPPRTPITRWLNQVGDLVQCSM